MTLSSPASVLHLLAPQQITLLRILESGDGDRAFPQLSKKWPQNSTNLGCQMDSATTPVQSQDILNWGSEQQCSGSRQQALNAAVINEGLCEEWLLVVAFKSQICVENINSKNLLSSVI